MTDRIGELLLRERLITPDQLKKAIDEQKKSGGRLGFNLTKLGYITEKDLTAFLSRQYGIPTIDLSSQEVDHEIVKLIPEDVAQELSQMQDKVPPFPWEQVQATLARAYGRPHVALAQVQADERVIEVYLGRFRRRRDGGHKGRGRGRPLGP